MTLKWCDSVACCFFCIASVCFEGSYLHVSKQSKELSTLFAIIRQDKMPYVMKGTYSRASTSFESCNYSLAFDIEHGDKSCWSEQVQLWL